MHACTQCIYLCVLLFVNIYLFIYFHPSIYPSYNFFSSSSSFSHGSGLGRSGQSQSIDGSAVFVCFVCFVCLFVVSNGTCYLSIYPIGLVVEGGGGEEGAVRIHLSVHCERVGRLSFKRTDRGESVYDDDNKERGGVWGGSEINFFKKKKKERKKEKGGGSSFHDFVVV